MIPSMTRQKKALSEGEATSEKYSPGLAAYLSRRSRHRVTPDRNVVSLAAWVSCGPQFGPFSTLEFVVDYMRGLSRSHLMVFPTAKIMV